MAKHRALRAASGRRSSVARLMAPGGLAAAAVGATGLSSALMTGATTAVAPSVDLIALITPANSTSQIFAGTTYYGNDYADDGYGEQQIVPFFLGPQGIADAISAADDDPDGIVVLSSGWGAGQTGTALGILAENDDPALNDIELVILDNNANRAGGGFWTTYSPFAPLLLTSAAPTPTDTGVPVLDVAYEYNINSSAPVDPLNPFALGNSLVAYLYGYGAQQTAVVPDDILAEAKDPTVQHYHYILDANGEPVGDPIPVDGTTTYVTFESDGLPLVRPLRLLPGGDIVADALEPTLTELVNAGYADGLGMEDNPAIPVDPTVPRPMQPGSSLLALGGVPDSVDDGLTAGAKTAQEDFSQPTNFVTKPVEEAGTLPVLSTLVDQPTEPATERSTAELADKSAEEDVLPDDEGNDDGQTATETPAKNKPGQRFTDRLNDVVKKVTDGASAATKNVSENDSTDSETD
ncbi:PE-PPE domain-containing protein [Mycobacterium sp. IS-1496]|uniref:PE-PPE domain-containing protein n=1 Tax=Mycobacterium sp. IS-1496 TaxID=1772284 RepID=UPI0007415433|nr:PE-PPE domain-containing protein [Mycobacterium sp. IS-1496]KUI29067.1 PE-PPE domain-containing protein [Mycobacterium sp. IS-1496]